MPSKNLHELFRFSDGIKLRNPGIHIMVKLNDPTVLRNKNMIYHSHRKQETECIADIIAAGNFIVLQEFFAGIGIGVRFLKSF